MKCVKLNKRIAKIHWCLNLKVSQAQPMLLKGQTLKNQNACTQAESPQRG